MATNTLKELENIFNNSANIEHRGRALQSSLTYHANELSTKELFSYIPYIWEKYKNPKITIRRKLENEIKRRQDKETFDALMLLLKSKHEYIRVLATDMLRFYPNKL